MRIAYYTFIDNFSVSTDDSEWSAREVTIYLLILSYRFYLIDETYAWRRDICTGTQMLPVAMKWTLLAVMKKPMTWWKVTHYTHRSRHCSIRLVTCLNFEVTCLVELKASSRASDNSPTRGKSSCVEGYCDTFVRQTKTAASKPLVLPKCSKLSVSSSSTVATFTNKYQWKKLVPVAMKKKLKTMILV